jgi:hypothetical protein
MHRKSYSMRHPHHRAEALLATEPDYTEELLFV